MNPSNLLDIKRIYVQKSAKNYSLAQRIIEEQTQAQVIEVNSHINWRQGSVTDEESNPSYWNKVKTQTLVLGVLANRACTFNERSTDYIAPSIANGCAMACNYCYVARRKGYSNPITLFVNYGDVLDEIQNHVRSLPAKQPNQCDAKYWIYDIGCNSDFSVDSVLAPSMAKNVIDFFAHSTAKASFATKYVNKDLLNLDPKKKVRIRFSLMPPNVSRLVDVRTSTIKDRIKAINDFYDAGYEVHVNFSPVIVYDGFMEDWKLLFQEINDELNQEVKDQLACEVIFLTHNEELHEVNLKWHPKGEDLLWQPLLQEKKTSIMGGSNLRYKWQIKQKWVNEFKESVSALMPYCRIRYAF